MAFSVGNMAEVGGNAQQSILNRTEGSVCLLLVTVMVNSTSVCHLPGQDEDMAWVPFLFYLIGMT